jgi:hypothetical protein
LTGADPEDGLEPYLTPLPFAGGALRFDLAGYRSTVTRQMLQVRLRMTARAFGSGPDLVAANVTADQTAVEVDAAALLAANARVRSALEAGAAASVACLRRLDDARVTLDRAAGGFRARISRGAPPGRRSFVAYVHASARHQALGALKFCVPGSLRETVKALVEEPDLVDALLAPETPTLWSTMSARELALAGLRLRGPSARYQRALVRHRHDAGYLRAEDVDFRADESLEAIDARLASLGAKGADALAGERRRLAQVVAADRAAKARAREVFADRLESAAPTEGVATLVSQVLLTRALGAHEDLNRRAKMRLLRDLRDLADLTGLDLERDGLPEFAAACPPHPERHAVPVLRSR